MGFFSDTPKRRTRRLGKGWAVWAHPEYEREAVFVAVHPTRKEAVANIRRLLRNAPWRKRKDYFIRRVTIR